MLMRVLVRKGEMQISLIFTISKKKNKKKNNNNKKQAYTLFCPSTFCFVHPNFTNDAICLKMTLKDNTAETNVHLYTFIKKKIVERICNVKNCQSSTVLAMTKF